MRVGIAPRERRRSPCALSETSVGASQGRIFGRSSASNAICSRLRRDWRGSTRQSDGRSPAGRARNDEGRQRAAAAHRGAVARPAGGRELLQRVERHRGGGQAERADNGRDGSERRRSSSGRWRRACRSAAPRSASPRLRARRVPAGIAAPRRRARRRGRKGASASAIALGPRRSFHSRSQSLGFSGWNASVATPIANSRRGDVEIGARPVEFDRIVVADRREFGEGQPSPATASGDDGEQGLARTLKDTRAYL